MNLGSNATEVALLRDVADEASFLLARIESLDWCDMDDLVRDWSGHVDPPLSRLTKLLDEYWTTFKGTEPA